MLSWFGIFVTSDSVTQNRVLRSTARIQKTTVSSLPQKLEIGWSCQSVLTIYRPTPSSPPPTNPHPCPFYKADSAGGDHPCLWWEEVNKHIPSSFIKIFRNITEGWPVLDWPLRPRSHCQLKLRFYRRSEWNFGLNTSILRHIWSCGGLVTLAGRGGLVTRI